jgi:predicted transposase/invertase (TIGR01784 family)
VFKWVFGAEGGTDVLRWLVDAVLGLPVGELDDVVLAATHRGPETHGGKEVVLDVTVRTTTGRMIDVEVQVLPMRGFTDRLAFYVARMLSGQLRSGEDYQELVLRPVVLVALTGFTMFTDAEDYHRVFHLRDQDHQVVLSPVLEVHTVELPKVPMMDDGSQLWAWSRFVAARTEEELDMVAAGNPHVAQAVQRVRHFTDDEQRRLDLEAHEKWLHDQATRLHTAHNEGRAEGHAQGLTQGRAEGGAAKGVEVARRALARGWDVSGVAEVTGLSVDEVRALARSEP